MINILIVALTALWVDLILAFVHFERAKDGNASFITMVWVGVVTIVLLALIFHRYNL